MLVPSSINFCDAHCAGSIHDGEQKERPPPKGVPVRDFMKTNNKSMGTPAREYRKESSNFFELSLCVEFIFAKENLFELCIDYEKSI